MSVYHHSEQGHQRQTQRIVEVFDCLAGIAQVWLGLRRFVRMQRQGTRDGKSYTQCSYYITSLATTAQQFAAGIRGHWGIENRLQRRHSAVSHPADIGAQNAPGTPAVSRGGRRTSRECDRSANLLTDPAYQSLVPVAWFGYLAQRIRSSNIAYPSDWRGSSRVCRR